MDPSERSDSEKDYTTSSREVMKPRRKGNDTTFHLRDKTPVFVLIALASIITLNFSAVFLSIYTLTQNKAEQYQTKEKEREMVAPLCVPCEKEGIAEGWRRYKKFDVEMCCPLDHHTLASAVHQIYRTVLEEKQEYFRRDPPEPISLFDFYPKPSNTNEKVLFANHHKPSAHVTAQAPFDATKYFEQDPNTSPDNTMQTVCDMPLRVERYRSTTKYVQRLTWGLMVPVSGLYRVHSNVNFYFGYPQSTNDMMTLAKTDKQVAVVHQLTRYHSADGRSTMLAQSNQTISSGHMDGVTSFLVTLGHLDIGDVISISVSHRSAMAMQDRWHSEGLFLVQ